MFSTPAQSHKFWYGRASNNQISTFKYTKPFVFTHHPENVPFLTPPFLNMMSFKPANGKSAFFEVTSFKSLFLVMFRVSTLNESHHLLVKLPYIRACENLDATSARSPACFFQPILQLRIMSSWAPLWLRFLYLNASDVHQHKFIRSQVATGF